MVESPATRAMPTPSQKHWLDDLMASVVVFMVALPLCLAIARASNMPAEAGILTGVIGGICVGAISGSPLQVSGPAAGLIVLTVNIIEVHGVAGLGVIVFLAGLMQLTAGLARVGPWFRAVSPAVVHGMLAGIGLMILCKQVHLLVDDVPEDSVLRNILSFPHAVAMAFADNDEIQPHHRVAACVGLLTMGVLIGWKRLAPKRIRMIPAPLVAVILAAAAGHLIDHDIKSVEVNRDLLASTHWLFHADRALFLDRAVWQAALAVALIASAETLLCATAIDRLHQGQRTRYNQELAAQGVGNLLCGVLGILPMTGVIVRSAANVEAGGKSRWSSILHGIWLLVFVIGFPSLLGMIPITALAAILIVTGFKLLDLPGIRAMWNTSRSEACILVATAIMIVSTDLLVGVMVGFGLALAKLLWTFSHLAIQLEIQPDQRQARLHLEGAATFLRLPQLADQLDLVPGDFELHVDFDKLTYIDHACLELLMNWEEQHETTGGSLVLDWSSLHARFTPPVARSPRAKLGNVSGSWAELNGTPERPEAIEA